MLQEEAQHFPGGIGSARIGVGTGGAAAGPGMASPGNLPVLCHRLPGVLKKNDIARFGEFRTARLVLNAWDRMAAEQPSGRVSKVTSS